jgi:hypothetical protein
MGLVYTMYKSFFTAVVAVLLIASPAPLWADGVSGVSGESDAAEYFRESDLSFELGIAGDFQPENIHDDLRGVLSYDTRYFDLLADFSASTDNEYPPSEQYLLGHHFRFENCLVGLEFAGMRLTAGVYNHGDVVDTPYSLYINSGDIPALNVDFFYDSPFFQYETRWIRVNSRSDYGYRDKGVNFKMYSLKFGDVRVGFEDAVVYMDTVFEPNYFLNPLPQYFTQLITTQVGTPYKEVSNANSLFGFFFDIDKPQFYISAQLLVDDINASGLAPVLGWAIPALYEVDNLTKIAWSLGGHVWLPFGRMGFYHGGATKYTFQATYTRESYSDDPYEYTYYPAVEYFRVEYGAPDSWVPIDYRENNIGYKYGENNLAFMIDYRNVFFPGRLYEFSLLTSFEWVLNGSKSPANPWHEHDWFDTIDEPVVMFDDEAVEHTIALRLRAEKPIVGLNFVIDGTFGWTFNQMALEPVLDAGGLPKDEPRIWVPQPGVHEPVLRLSIGVSYGFSISDLWQKSPLRRK